VSLISDTCGCREYFFTAVLMWYQQTYQVTNYVLQKRVFEKSASGDRYDLPGAVPGTWDGSKGRTDPVMPRNAG